MTERAVEFRACVYCGQNKQISAFDEEHIWPEALGGDFLPARLFRTNDVCNDCNSLAGRFADGAFLKSWFGQTERVQSGYQYLDLDISSQSVVPLQFMGQLEGFAPNTDDVFDLWHGPCGNQIIHARMKDIDDVWATYAGGDPVARKRNPGRVYLSFTTTNIQWIALTLRSLKAQFERADRYVTNAGLPPEWQRFASPVDEVDPAQAKDLEAIRRFQDPSQRKGGLKFPISIHLDHRFLAKVSLGLGYTILGEQFLQTDYALHLRKAIREANPEKRAGLPLFGSSYFETQHNGGLKPIAFPGAWVLILTIVGDAFTLGIITPSGKSMVHKISDTPELWRAPQYKEYYTGAYYVVVPTLARAVGPLSAPHYINHVIGNRPHPDLSAIDAKRVDRSSLPPCR